MRPENRAIMPCRGAGNEIIPEVAVLKRPYYRAFHKASFPSGKHRDCPCGARCFLFGDAVKKKMRNLGKSSQAGTASHGVESDMALALELAGHRARSMPGKLHAGREITVAADLRVGAAAVALEHTRVAGDRFRHQPVCCVRRDASKIVTARLSCAEIARHEGA